MVRLLVCVLLLGVPASAQVIQASAGRSTLLVGTGGQITAFFPQSTVSTSAGFANGHFVFGSSYTFKIHGLEITAGDRAFGYAFDGAGLGISTRGIFVQHSTRRTLFAVFVGSTGIGYATPFMVTATTQHMGAGIFLEHHFDNGLVLSSLAVTDGGKQTAVQGLSYSRRVLGLTGSGGFLQNQKYFTGEADYQPVPRLRFSATHNDYFLSGLLTTNSLSTFAALGRVTLMASVLDGRYKTAKTSGASAGAGLRIGSATVRSNIYESNHRILLVHSVQEQFRRWSLSGIVNQARGQTSYAAGGGYRGNKVSISVDHSVLFFPASAKAFQQTTTVQISLRIHDTSLNFQTNVDPMMRMQYTAYASTYIQGPFAGLVRNNSSHSRGGKFVVAGTVVDEQGQPMEGAAIQLQGTVVYSDSRGRFFVRVKHNKPLALVVLPSEFAAPGVWAVTDCPVDAMPGTEVLIRLRRETAP
jgi:hypothetical protein